MESELRDTVGIREAVSYASLVDQILTAKRDDPDADISGLVAKIDQLVHELYGLSKEEIEIMEGSVGS